MTRILIVSAFYFAQALLTVYAEGDVPWLGGGVFDGFDTLRAGGAPDYPQLDNADGATNVTVDGAHLNGTLIHAGVAPSEVFVFWGKTDHQGRDTSGWENSYSFGVATELELLTVHVPLDGNTVYYYRFYAVDGLGHEGWAMTSFSFKTPGLPVVSTGSGVAVVGFRVKLNGALTGGGEAEMKLYWGEAEEGVPPDVESVVNLGVRTEAGSLEAPNPFKEQIDGLFPDTGYAYRLWAENEHGSVYSSWVWFKTRPADFVIVWDPAWLGGGVYDGYDLHMLVDAPMPGGAPGTIITSW